MLRPLWVVTGGGIEQSAGDGHRLFEVFDPAGGVEPGPVTETQVVEGALRVVMSGRQRLDRVGGRHDRLVQVHELMAEIEPDTQGQGEIRQVRPPVGVSFAGGRDGAAPGGDGVVDVLEGVQAAMPGAQRQPEAVQHHGTHTVVLGLLGAAPPQGDRLVQVREVSLALIPLTKSLAEVTEQDGHLWALVTGHGEGLAAAGHRLVEIRHVSVLLKTEAEQVTEIRVRGRVVLRLSRHLAEQLDGFLQSLRRAGPLVSKA
ncbi:hypothetical protein GCM10010112_65400 [Actinoplanes lobatus]|uniref:Uncharacterized protein n=1 Tax=Actinoplanes lobatus TaxID=113568 RepID=A0ABQ4ATM8_9ACTN|nr:hypothetical protein GCM10010112_65400 [Actinoplanes lobatus]GIE44289.1 hypothetical protein Alo02nite_71870 [Actinoplanes lobatus]